MSVLCDNETTTKPCIHCGHHKPLQHFRRVYKHRDDARHSECNHCRKRNELRKRFVQRRRKLSKGLSQLRQTECPVRLNVLANRLIRECGGLTRMVDLARQSFDGPGQSGFRQQCIASVIHLLIKADELQAKTPFDREPEMSSEELNTAFQWRVEKLIKDQPSVAAAALRTAGWTVTAPEK